MERLTEKHYLAEGHYMKCSVDCHVDIDCIDCPAFDRLVDRLAAYEDTGMTPEEIKSAFTTDALIKLAAQALETTPERLRELAEADKDGRVVVLPCKVGDTVWVTAARVIGKWMPEQLSQPDAAVILGAYIDKDGKYLFETERYTFERGIIGKAVFLTREEAERALEGNG